MRLDLEAKKHACHNQTQTNLVLVTQRSHKQHSPCPAVHPLLTCPRPVGDVRCAPNAPHLRHLLGLSNCRCLAICNVTNTRLQLCSYTQLTVLSLLKFHGISIQSVGLLKMFHILLPCNQTSHLILWEAFSHYSIMNTWRQRALESPALCTTCPLWQLKLDTLH